MILKKEDICYALEEMKYYYHDATIHSGVHYILDHSYV